MEPQNPTVPTPPQPKKNNLVVILLSIFLAITLFISGYLYSRVQKLSREITNLQRESNVSNTTSGCKECSEASDPVCINNTSCFIPTGELKGVCVPVAKPGEVYTNDQINQICGTKFENDATADWKTYSYEPINYSFKYPPTFYPSQCEGGVELFTKPTQRSGTSCETPPFGIIRIAFDTKHIETGYLESTDYKLERQESLSINNILATKKVGKRLVDGPGPSDFIEITFGGGNGYYYLLFSEDLTYETTLDQILSTFKFTD